MEDVAAGDAEARLELARAEREAVDDAVREARADLGEAGDRRVGRGLGVDVGREALAEHARARGGPAGRASGRPRSGRRPRSTAGPPGARRARRRRRPRRSSSVKPMSIVPAHGSRAGPGREVGQPVEQEHDLDRRAVLAPALRRGHGRPAAAVRSGSALDTTRAAAELLPALEHDAGGAAVLDERRARPARRVRIARARRLGGGAQRAGDRAHPAAREAPRARRAGRLAEVVVEADEGRARVLGRGQRADQALDRERDADLLATGCRARSSAIEPSRISGPTASSQRSRSAGSSISGRARAAARSQRSRPARRSRRRRRGDQSARRAGACGALAARPRDDLRPSGSGANR